MKNEQEKRNEGSLFKKTNEYKGKHTQRKAGIWKTVILQKARGESGQKARHALGTRYSIQKAIAAVNFIGKGNILSGQDGKSPFLNIVGIVSSTTLHCVLGTYVLKKNWCIRGH